MKGQEPCFFFLDFSVEQEEKGLLGPYRDNQKLHLIAGIHLFNNTIIQQWVFYTLQRKSIMF